MKNVLSFALDVIWSTSIILIAAGVVAAILWMSRIDASYPQVVAVAAAFRVFMVVSNIIDERPWRKEEQ